MRTLFAALAVLSVTIGCSDGLNELANRQIETRPAEQVEGVEFEFVRFTETEVFERVAEFRLNNGSQLVIVGFQGDLKGLDANEKEIYDMPWSSSSIPHIAKPGETVARELGAHIPSEVKTVIFEPIDYDVVLE